MNLDRATLNFLNTFPEDARAEGENLHKDGCVTQIFGNHLFIQGRVEMNRGRVFETSLRLQGNRWVGSSSSESGGKCPCLVATMLERLQRGENLPEAPDEVGNESIEEILEKRLGRGLEESEEKFLGKLMRRFRKFAIEKVIYDHDLVRINPRWEVTGYEPLSLWPTPPSDVVQFWNYLAYAMTKRGLKYPEFMDAITDLNETQEQLESWEEEQEIGEWEERVREINNDPPGLSVLSGSMRLMVTTNNARLQWRGEGEEDFVTITGEDGMAEWLLRQERGALRLDPGSELLWIHFLTHRQETGDEDLRLESLENCRFLNHLFRQAAVRDHLVTLDERGFEFVDGRLEWVCVEQEPRTVGEKTVAELKLVMPDREPVFHALRVLPGAEVLYLSDDALFEGPPLWVEGSEVLPRYELPWSVVATGAGVEFMARIEAQLPESLAARVEDAEMKVTIRAELRQGLTAAGSEHLVLSVDAVDPSGSRREVLGKEGWRTEDEKAAADGKLFRFDRTRLYQFPELLDSLVLSYDASIDAFKARVVRTFPERFTQWVESLPGGVSLEVDASLQTLLDDPVKAQLRFELVDQNIDWFDLKIVVQIEGYDLSPEEIKALVAARGEFVRMKRGGWLRIEFDMGEEQREAVSRLGLDPFDLSGETHRMHALQLADPKAKEVFDPEAWEKISDRSRTIKLQVRPAIPEGLHVTLRPYQVEGFHFLAYISVNEFGGILADDMGLGKTVQALAWLMWLRSRVKKGDPKPALVVCPKSVLDVWAGEVEKFSPQLRVQVLRDKSELDMSLLGKDIDMLVLNYSQLRVCSEHLNKQEWLAVILDEGQQIKNPDSKAAKAARLLTAGSRLVLTGTPIENRLLDVWSLMAFAMPGILGDRKYFRDRFDRRKDPNSQVRLSARLRPFLLRRTKGQVAMDLPPRTEEDVLCKMENVQLKLYQDEIARIQKILLGLESDEALRKNSFVVLQGLMRLRQICCHPALIDQQYRDAESAKMNALFYLLDQLQEEGHKVLVFSQFVTMLDIVRERLESENRPFNYLTGQTKDRQKEIEEFQTRKDPSAFLLSLKAGGSGLNLTAASYVVLYDPWWNPAVENQAIDRTHRIGQTSKVIAYRLLMSNSVEEKIRILQSEKQKLSGDVLGEESFTRNLEMKDIQYLFSPEEKTAPVTVEV